MKQCDSDKCACYDLMLGADRQAEQRYRDAVRVEATAFCIKFADELALVPLANMALLCELPHRYTRPIYNEYRLLSRDVQMRVAEALRLEYMNPDGETVSGEHFPYYLCRVLGDFSISPQGGVVKVFYGATQYIYSALKVGNARLRLSDGVSLSERIDSIKVALDLEVDVTDVTSIDLLGYGPIERSFNQCIAAAYLCCDRGEDYAFPEDEYGEPIASFGAPGRFLTSQAVDLRLEDFFLWALFEIYTHVELSSRIDEF